MRQRLFSMLGSGRMLTRAGRAATALLAVAMLTMSAQTAKAGSKLFAKISTSDNTTMTLVCADATPSEAGYTFTEFTGSDSWSTAFRATITSATVASSCGEYSGTTLKDLFYGFNNLLTITDIGNLNTSSVTDMSFVFDSCKKLTSLNLSGWNTANVTTMYYMFSNCDALTTLDLSTFNTEKVTTMSLMFDDCDNLASLNLGGTFKSEKVTNMSQMFHNCKALTTLDLSNLKTDKVQFMTRMFNGCTLLATITVGDGWSTAGITSSSNSEYMFANCTALVGRSGTTYDADHTDKTYARLDYGEVEHGYLTANGLYAKMSGTDMTVSYGIDKTAIAYYKEGTGFAATCKTATSVTLDATCASYSPTTLANMFYGFSAATSIIGLEYLNTANVTNMSYMFRNCSKVTSLPGISAWNTENVTDMSYTFCDNTLVTLLDLSGWNTAEVTNMTSMFDDDGALKAIIVGSDWSTAKVTSSSRIFNSCSNLHGAEGTAYVSDISYAKIDGGTGSPGCLTGTTRTLTAGGPDGESKYWATFFNSAVGYSITGGEAFAGVYNSGTKTITLTSLGTDIPANTPVVICATSGTVNMTVDNTIAAYTGSNNLHGVDVQTATPANSYCLAIGGSGAGFYKYTSSDGANIPARRAYMTISGGAALARGYVGFSGDDETTGIALPETMEDGQDVELYDLSGRLVSGQAQKGVYVKNGKKVVIK